MSFTAFPKDVQSPRREVSFVLSAREAGEVWREEKSHKHYGGERAKEHYIIFLWGRGNSPIDFHFSVLHASRALMVEILKDFYLCFSLECDNFEIDDMPEGKLFVLILLQVKSETSLLVNRLKLAATIWLLTHDCI